MDAWGGERIEWNATMRAEEGEEGEQRRLGEKRQTRLS
jgi:hypothetical protein